MEKPVSFKAMDEIHFSVHSVLTDEIWHLKNQFFEWVAGDSEDIKSEIDLMTSPLNKSDIPEEIRWCDIVEYCCGIPMQRQMGMTEGQIEELRILRMTTAESLWDRFIHEGISDCKKDEIEKKWNSRFNSFDSVDYENFDCKVEGFSGKLDDKEFVLHEQQKKGVAFLCSKGNGLLAYDVGVGKTATGIVSAVYQIQHGNCKRPLIVVPNAVYSKWVHDTKELFPQIQVNELFNLNSEIIAGLCKKQDDKISELLRKVDFNNFEETKSDFSQAELIPEKSISICTTEALEKLYFRDKSFEQLEKRFEYLISERKMYEMFSPPEILTEEFKTDNKFLYFEDLGFDLLVVDEAHRYKNLFKKTVSNRTYSEFSNLSFGEPSVRALKMFALTEYVHHHNNEKNVFFLTATPFTNSPFEIYSMLRFVGGKQIQNLGFSTINEFLNEFAEIKIEWSVARTGKVEKKTVMKNFRSLYALQNIIRNYIDKVNADEANILRPEKITYVKKIEMTPLQQKIYDYEIKRLEIGATLGDIFIAMNNMRMCMISPALLNPKTKMEYLSKNLKIPPVSKIVEESPKLTAVCSTVLNVYKEKPLCGQIIYMPRGVKESSEIKKYFVSRGIKSDAIALVNSSTSDEDKETITDRFNDPDDCLKILIGSESISEGVDLNGNSLVLYNTMLGWNPTEPIQVEGRLWRQGNRQKKVHVVYPLMYNSIESLIYQKHDEKATRIDAIFEYKGDKINVEEINPSELKFDLIRDPKKKAKVLLEKDALPIRRELKIIADSRELLKNSEQKIQIITESIAEEKNTIQKLDEYISSQMSQSKIDGLPENLRDIMRNAFTTAQADKIAAEEELKSKEKSLKMVQVNLQKKMDYLIKQHFSESEYKQLDKSPTEQKKETVLKKLAEKESELNQKLENLFDDLKPVIESIEQQTKVCKVEKPESVESLVEKLSADILTKEY
ncbi:MAG: SNF2-related protein [Spirochaetales bacterium]|nr:SNF2-related protein [Spirochaetales bacterium]